MATETRTTNSVVEDLLLAKGERYGYFQAVRLLRLFDHNTGLRQENLRVRPKLTLGFPENDIDNIERLPQGGYQIVANFFGLYGVASPLPTYYTEELFEEEREGRQVTREFLDIVNYAMYPLLFDAWSKYRLQRRIVEEEDSAVLDLLYAFIGLNRPELRVDLLPGSAELLRYAGLLSQRPRSALGLQTLLSDAFAPLRVDLECCVPRTQEIPLYQQWRLGYVEHGLGEAIYLGRQIDDYTGLRISLSNVGQTMFQQLLPGEAGHERLRFLTYFYVSDPLDIEVVIDLRHEDARTARMVGTSGVPQWSRLGLDTWLAPEQVRQPTRIQFSL